MGSTRAIPSSGVPRHRCTIPIRATTLPAASRYPLDSGYLHCVAQVFQRPIVLARCRKHSSQLLFQHSNHKSIVLAFLHPSQRLAITLHRRFIGIDPRSAVSRRSSQIAASGTSVFE